MIHFISVNIETNRHLDRVKALVEREAPDVVCFQEVLRRDLPFLMEIAGPHLAWAPMAFMDAAQDVQGVAMISRHHITDIRAACYMGDPDTLKTYVSDRDYGSVDRVNYYLLMATIHVGGVNYRVGTTHAPVTQKGSVTPGQMQAIHGLIDMAKSEPELIMCGDFNAPRGVESFDTIAGVYKDNIPARYDTSLDPVLHRAGPLPGVMVDGLFTTPHYQVSNVRLQDGVSDHCAIIADIARL